MDNILEFKKVRDQDYSYNQKPLVSIGCITYNHEKYIRDAMEGFLNQKTNFPIEILIHDDASTDKTADIIREYEKQYPNIIKPIYQIENQYSKHDGTIRRLQRGRIKGKYYALCEGDDYWIDPLKLQKQVEFLERNTDCSVCFHASKSIKNNDINNFEIHKPSYIPTDYKFETKHAILGGGGFMATNSMVMLKEYVTNTPDWMNKAPVGDLPLMLLLATKGKIGYIDEVMSVYRVASSSTAWSVRMQDPKLMKKHHYAISIMWSEFDEWTDGKYHKYVKKKKRINNRAYYRSRLKNLLNRFLAC